MNSEQKKELVKLVQGSKQVFMSRKSMLSSKHKILTIQMAATVFRMLWVTIAMR